MAAPTVTGSTKLEFGAGATTKKVPKPTGAAAGNNLFVVLSFFTTATVTPPAGWELVPGTEQSKFAPEEFGCAVYQLLNYNGTTTEWTFTFSKSVECGAAIIAVGGASTATPVSAKSGSKFTVTEGSKSGEVPSFEVPTAENLILSFALNNQGQLWTIPSGYASIQNFVDVGVASIAGPAAKGSVAKAKWEMSGGTGAVAVFAIAVQPPQPAVLPLSPAAGAASSALALHAPTRIPLSAAAGAAATAMTLSAPTKAVLPLNAAAGAASTAMTLRVQPRLALSAAGAAATAMTLTAPTHTPSRVMVTREFPPDKLAVLVRASDGTLVGRWSEDEPLIENVVSNLTKDGEMPRGHKEMSCVLARDPRLAFPDLGIYSDIEIEAPGGEKIWVGRLERAPQTDGDHLMIEPAAAGHYSLLEDDEGATVGFIDGDMTRWGEPSAGRKALPGVQFWHLNSNAQSQLLPAGGTEKEPTPAAIAQTWSQMKSNGGTELDVAESWVGGVIELGEVLLDFLPIKNMGGAWKQLIWSAVDNIGAAATEIHNFGSTAATEARFAIAVGQFFLFLESYFPEAYEGEAMGGWEVQFRNIKILSRIATSLGLQGTWPHVGFTAKQMLPIIAAMAGLSTTDESLEDDGFVIPQAWFSTPAMPSTFVNEVTKYGLLDPFVFEDKLLQYRFPGTYGRKWQAYAGPSGLKSTGQDGTRIWDKISVAWQDVDGTTKIAGPPGSGAMFESSLLQLTDPNNPAVAMSVPKKKLLVLNEVCTESLAIKAAARFLEEAAQLDHSGEATITGYVQDEHGIWLPSSYIQPGDEIRFPDGADTSYRRITAQPYTRESRTASLTLDAPPQGQAALEERFNARLLELGL